MIRHIIFILTIIYYLFSSQTNAQEINAKLTFNTQKVSVNNREIFTSMEQSVNSLLNERKWTDASFSRNERIDCTIAITINEMPAENTFSAEIQLTSRRPVYNSTYITTLLNYRDTELSFNYVYGQIFDYNENSLNNNLVATIAFYVYIIIGLDFDSFSPNGGRPFFEKAMQIANMAQSLNTTGWEPFSGKNNRYALALALTEESSKSFHTSWYTYHRLGLDEMAANASRARIRVIESLNDIKNLYTARPSSPLLPLYSEAKLDEVVRICAQATNEEKQEVRELLKKIFPGKTSIINQLK